jgi:hypothetical protein
MKIKILGLTVFEIETNLPAVPPGPPAGAGFLEQDRSRVTGATAGHA